MKRFFIFLLFTFFCIPCFSEAIKLKSGVIINGSIIGQSEYILRVQTSYGPITLNQREIEKIMPDLHRVLLKGGGEYVGTVVDLDEFNLSLNTDSGLVNIDVSQISSMEVYDYEEAEKQKKYIENKLAKEEALKAEQQAKAVAVPVATIGATSAITNASLDSKTANAGANLGQSSLAFDDDLERVFPSKPEVVEQQPQYIYKTYDERNNITEPEEKQELALTETEKKQLAKEEELSFDQEKKRASGKNYFAVQAGVLNSNINVDLSDLQGPNDFSVSGTKPSFSISYMRRFSKNFWLGGGVGFSMLAKKQIYFDLEEPKEQRFVETSGKVYDINLLANYYINPESQFRFYLTAGAGYTILQVDENPAHYQNISTDPQDPNYSWVTESTKTINSNGISGNVGLGVEYTIQDINLGLEVRLRYMGLKNQLQDSRKINTIITLKTSWFF